LQSSAGGAQTSHRKSGAKQRETLDFGGTGSGIKDSLTFKLFCSTANRTHQVVVLVVFCISEFKTATSLWQLQFMEKIHGGEEAKRPVDRGQRNTRVCLEKLLMNVLCAEVMSSTHALKQVKHALTLGGQPLSTTMQVLAKIARNSHGWSRLFLIVGLIERRPTLYYALKPRPQVPHQPGQQRLSINDDMNFHHQ
tara:strand:- start:488 stop:1072 length:585 start_codon:yes stop_codon:yes gene_type:complete